METEPKLPTAHHQKQAMADKAEPPGYDMIAHAESQLIVSKASRVQRRILHKQGLISHSHVGTAGGNVSKGPSTITPPL